MLGQPETEVARTARNAHRSLNPDSTRNKDRVSKLSIFEAAKADLIVNKRFLDRASVMVFRVNQAAHRGSFRLGKRAAAKAIDSLWLQWVVGADLPGRAACGRGLRLPHGARGVTIHPNVDIGENCTIYHRVTIGGYSSDKFNVPTLGDGVYVGVGASILGRVKVGRGTRVGAGAILVGDISVGNDARIGAGAVVDRDVAPGEIFKNRI